MNNTSAFNNFGRYFSYDLRRAWYACGLSALCVGLLPVTGYIFGLLFTVTGILGFFPTNTVTTTLLPIASILYITVFPAKLYGEVTNRRAGSNFLMLPASTGVKFASLLIMLLIVLPFAVTALFCISDLLLSIIPSYGQSLVSRIGSHEISIWLRSTDFENSCYMGLWAAAGIEQFFDSVLFFALGAIIFKRKKAGKTILSLIGIMSVVALIFILITTKVFTIEDIDVDKEMFEWSLAILCNVVNIAVGVLLGYFIHRRLRKIEL